MNTTNPAYRYEEGKIIGPALNAWGAGYVPVTIVCHVTAGDAGTGGQYSHYPAEIATRHIEIMLAALNAARVLPALPQVAQCENESHFVRCRLAFDHTGACDFGPEPKDQAEPARLLRVFYVCPRCSHEWEEEYSCACDSECPECELENIEADRWEDIDAEPEPTPAEPAPVPAELTREQKLENALRRVLQIAVWDEDFDADDRAEFDAATEEAGRLLKDGTPSAI